MEEYSGIRLLMGDLNAEPHSSTIRSVGQMIILIFFILIF